jgi:hypothetical protein
MAGHEPRHDFKRKRHATRQALQRACHVSRKYSDLYHRLYGTRNAHYSVLDRTSGQFQ